MRKLLAIAFAAATLHAATANLNACGDKFLRIGRALSLSRSYVAAHRASILIYLRPDSGLSLAARDLKLPSTLKHAGHDVRVVEQQRDLESALSSGQFDIVLADPSAIAVLNSQEKTGRPGPRVVPVLYKPTKDQIAATEKQYGFLLVAPSKASQALAEIELVMEDRLKTAKSGL